MTKIIENWYFGLFMALILNGLTHEHYTTVFAINDKIARTKIININESLARIIKTRRGPFDFEIVEEDDMKISDLEKTILDFLHFRNYGTIPKELA